MSWSLQKDGHIEGPGPQLVLQNTQVGAWSVRARDSVSLTIKDSVIGRLGIGLLNPFGTIAGIRPGFYRAWSLKENNSLITPLDVRLVNTTIRGHGNLIISGLVDLQISDSELASLSLAGASGVITADNTQLEAIQAGNTTATLDFSAVNLARV